MKTTMDHAGRLVIPKEIRREARLAPGVPLEVKWREGRIEIEPAARRGAAAATRAASRRHAAKEDRCADARGRGADPLEAP